MINQISKIADSYAESINEALFNLGFLDATNLVQEPIYKPLKENTINFQEGVRNNEFVKRLNSLISSMLNDIYYETNSSLIGKIPLDFFEYYKAFSLIGFVNTKYVFTEKIGSTDVFREINYNYLTTANVSSIKYLKERTFGTDMYYLDSTLSERVNRGIEDLTINRFNKPSWFIDNNFNLVEYNFNQVELYDYTPLAYTLGYMQGLLHTNFNRLGDVFYIEYILNESNKNKLYLTTKYNKWLEKSNSNLYNFNGSIDDSINVYFDKILNINNLEVFNNTFIKNKNYGIKTYLGILPVYLIGSLNKENSLYELNTTTIDSIVNIDSIETNKHINEDKVEDLIKQLNSNTYNLKNTEDLNRFYEETYNMFSYNGIEWVNQLVKLIKNKDYNKMNFDLNTFINIIYNDLFLYGLGSLNSIEETYMKHMIII